ncbi:uncharacterized protein mrvi1 isoform X2 [Synchiropus splendidus]|uniref:uncharacterized protein mrvi1 isoform X2 n=1 Tax=Synchiropus splendidus TaxID=270530 RepID=UPI00237D8D18|nr:uncharacterized protein mrvi1 isoform X2 [Synchiropus splendidus]
MSKSDDDLSETSGTVNVSEDAKIANGFSDQELLDIMYNACNPSGTGEVPASAIINYLETMMAESPDQDRLTALRLLLDPDFTDSTISRETFHSTIREWISQCNQDEHIADTSFPKPSEVQLNGLDYFSSENKASSSENHRCSCNGEDLSGTVSELKLAQRKLSEQNSSLMKTVAQCEDVNLQLTLEVTELRAKLASAQRAAVRARAVTEELEETRHAFIEAQERISRTQSGCTKLSNEIENLKGHIRRLEEKNEKLIFERSCSEESINKLRKVNADLRAELQETLVMLSLSDREVTKKDILMDKLKSSHAENYNIIEGLQSELMRLQEHSHQILLRYDRFCIRPQSLSAREPPNLRSLQSEMQDTQQHHKPLEDVTLPTIHSHTDGIHSIILRLKSAEKAHLQNKNSERVFEAAPVDTQERPFPHPQQASIKRQLVNVLQELELQKCVWEEKADKVEERLKTHHEQNQVQTRSQSQMTHSKKVAVVNWWKAFSAEGAKAQNRGSHPNSDPAELTKLPLAEQTISDMRQQICNLQAALKSAQECVAEQKSKSQVLTVNRETNTDREEAVEKQVNGQRDAAVETEAVHIAAGEEQQTNIHATADKLLVNLRRMEAMVSSALETAELVRESEQRVHQVRVRMERITEKVEAALGRAANTDQQLSHLEAQVAENEESSTEASADHTTDATDFTSVFDEEPQTEDSTHGCLPAPAVPEVCKLSAFPMNDGGEHGSSSKVQESKRPLLLGSLLDYTTKGTDHSVAAESHFIFPQTRSRPTLPPAMPSLPEEEEDSPEELDSSSSSPSTPAPCESRAVVMTAPTIIYPQQAAIVQQDGRQQATPHSPRSRVPRNSSGSPITTIDSSGAVIDLVKDPLPEPQLSEEDRRRNLELLEQAKRVSDRFLTRRGRRSTSSLSDVPQGLSPPPTPSSPLSPRGSLMSMGPKTGPGSSEGTCVSPKYLDFPPVREQPTAMTQDIETSRLLVDWKLPEKRKVSSGSLKPRYAVQKEICNPTAPKSPPAGSKSDEGSCPSRNPNQPPATGVAKPVPRPPTQQAPCTAEIKTIGAFPPLMRAVSWDSVGGGLGPRGGPPALPPTAEDARETVFKPSGPKDHPVPAGAVQKLTKIREEHKLIRTQSITGSKLPDLSEASEQEKGNMCAGSPGIPHSSGSGERKEKSDAMPNISDLMLRKLKLHKGLPGCAPPLTEKEVENAFVQLSLAFRNDNYTLETRLKQAERERNLTEEDTEKELEEFKNMLKMTSPQWQNMEQREAYQRLVETLSVLRRLATRLSSRAELVGAVRQEKRMNKATEVMMQYVDNLKRTYEKDHAELMEFKKLANQNSNRGYAGSAESGDDGSRSSRSMSLTMGKALPRRRVSVAVVPKFNLLNIPGQSPPTAGPTPNPCPNTGPNPALNPNSGTSPGNTLPALSEASDVKGNASSEAAPTAKECGKSVPEQESESTPPPVNLEEIRAEIKAKIEEEAYNRGFQEGLKQSKALQEEKLKDEDALERLMELKIKDEESGKKIITNRRMEEVLAILGRICPKISWSRRLLWFILTVLLVMCLVISILTFFSDYYNRHEDT